MSRRGAQLLAIGDTHCRFDILEGIVAAELGRDPELAAVLHCGDIGIYDPGSRQRLSRRELELIEKHRNPIELCYPYLSGDRELPVPLYGIPGNHEDFELVEELERGRRRLEGFELMPPGVPLRLGLGDREITVLGLGRILPDDLSPRSRHKAKYITEEALEWTRAAAARQRPDILMLHEPPALELPDSGRRFGSTALLELVEAIEPPLVLFGHMHFELDARLGQSRLYGLGYGARGRYALIDEELEVSFRGAADPEVTRAMPGPGGGGRSPSARRRMPRIFETQQILEHFKLGKLRKRERKRIEAALDELAAEMSAAGERPPMSEIVDRAEALLRQRGILGASGRRR